MIVITFNESIIAYDPSRDMLLCHRKYMKFFVCLGYPGHCFGGGSVGCLKKLPPNHVEMMDISKERSSGRTHTHPKRNIMGHIVKDVPDDFYNCFQCKELKRNKLPVQLGRGRAAILQRYM